MEWKFIDSFCAYQAVDAARRANVLLFANSQRLQLIVDRTNGQRVMTTFFSSQ
jgi:hypothetical protein